MQVFEDSVSIVIEVTSLIFNDLDITEQTCKLGYQLLHKSPIFQQATPKGRKIW